MDNEVLQDLQELAGRQASQVTLGRWVLLDRQVQEVQAVHQALLV